MEEKKQVEENFDVKESELSSTTATTTPTTLGVSNQGGRDTDVEESDSASELERAPLRFGRAKNQARVSKDLRRYKDLCLTGGIGADSSLRYNAWVALLKVADIDPKIYIGKEGEAWAV